MQYGVANRQRQRRDMSDLEEIFQQLLKLRMVRLLFPSIYTPANDADCFDFSFLHDQPSLLVLLLFRSKRNLENEQSRLELLLLPLPTLIFSRDWMRSEVSIWIRMLLTGTT